MPTKDERRVLYGELVDLLTMALSDLRQLQYLLQEEERDPLKVIHTTGSWREESGE